MHENIYERGMKAADRLLAEQEVMLVEAGNLLKRAVTGKLEPIDVSRAKHWIGKVARKTRKV